MAPNGTSGEGLITENYVPTSNGIVKVDTVDSPGPSPPDTPIDERIGNENYAEPSYGLTPPVIAATNTFVSDRMRSVRSVRTDIPPPVAMSRVSTSSVSPGRTLASTGMQHENMRREINRLKTFERWPVTFMNPRQMAAAGFFYTGRADIVKCAFCSSEFNNWQEGDNPAKDHRRWAPHCPFVLRIPIGNEPLSESGESGDDLLEDDLISYDTCGTHGIQILPFSGPEKHVNEKVSLEKLGVCSIKGPVFPNYATLEARLATYSSWPLSLRQRPDKLSDAGFYYTGKGDQTVCYYCGGGLKDWEDNDDPWTEHALWFSKCGYVLLMKGPEFVKEVASKKNTVLTAQEALQLENRDEIKSLVVAAVSSSSSDVSESIAGPSGAGTSSQSSERTSDKLKDLSIGENEKKTDDTLLCKICYVNNIGVVFLPCGHLLSCAKCAASLSSCAVCRQPINGMVRTYLP